VLGPSGAGKTTWFRALVGESRHAGRIRLGRTTTRPREPLWRSGLGAASATFPQVPKRALGSDGGTKTSKPSSPSCTAQPRLGAKVWADTVELGPRSHVRGKGDLSGGERRRLELARALLARPAILVCDDLFAGIDPAGAERLGGAPSAPGTARMGVILADHHHVRRSAPYLSPEPFCSWMAASRLAGTPDEFSATCHQCATATLARGALRVIAAQLTSFAEDK